MQLSLREALVEGGLEAYRVVVESLSTEFDLVQIASAAVKLMMKEEGEPGPAASEPEPATRVTVPPALQGPARREKREPRERPQARGSQAGFVKLFVGAGKRAGIRPADLVGAIANEAGLEANRIGSIQITDVYSLVEVPEELAGRVMGALRQTTLRGRKVKVDRQRTPAK